MRSLFAFSAACRRVMVTAAAIGVCLFGTAAREARADIIVALPGEPGETTAPFSWLYDVFLAEGQEVRYGATFTIYDFAGLIGSSTPVFWEFSTTPLTPTPLADPLCTDPVVCNPPPSDDPDIANLNWTYRGTAIISGGTPESPVQIGVFGAFSTFDYTTAVDAWFAGLAFSEDQDILDADPLAFNSAPGTQVPSAPEVPEPGSMLLLGTGLFGAAAMIRRRRAAQV